MRCQSTRLSESLPACLADKRRFPCMRPLVRDQVGWLREPFATSVTETMSGLLRVQRVACRDLLRARRVACRDLLRAQRNACRDLLRAQRNACRDLLL